MIKAWYVSSFNANAIHTSQQAQLLTDLICDITVTQLNWLQLCNFTLQNKVSRS